MKRLFRLTLAFALFTSCEAKYDIVLKNGIVFDGQALSEEPKDVAIIGDRIVGIGNFKEATSTFDVTGSIISPGFIDAHAHIENIMRLSDAQSALRQGVTTALGGPDSISWVFVNGKLAVAMDTITTGRAGKVLRKQ